MNIKNQSDINIRKKKSGYFTQAKDFGMLALGIVAGLYVLNITFGVVELLPDNLPFVGNIDEALVTAVLVSVLQYFNINITHWFKRT